MAKIPVSTREYPVTSLHLIINEPTFLESLPVSMTASLQALSTAMTSLLSPIMKMKRGMSLRIKNKAPSTRNVLSSQKTPTASTVSGIAGVVLVVNTNTSTAVKDKNEDVLSTTGTSPLTKRSSASSMVRIEESGEQTPSTPSTPVVGIASSSVVGLAKNTPFTTNTTPMNNGNRLMNTLGANNTPPQAEGGSPRAFTPDATTGVVNPYAQQLLDLCVQLPSTMMFLNTNDTNNCLVFNNHSSAITSITVTASGDYILVTSEDGSVTIYSTILQLRNSTSSLNMSQHGTGSDVVQESSLVLTNRYLLSHMKHQLSEVALQILIAKQECDGKIAKANKIINDTLINKHQEYINNITELQAKFDKERNTLTHELELLQQQSEDKIKTLEKQLKDQEYRYEKKLMKKNDEMDAFKQAFSEVSYLSNTKFNATVESLKTSEASLLQNVELIQAEVNIQKGKDLFIIAGLQ